MLVGLFILEIILVCLCSYIYAECEREPNLIRLFIAICPIVNLAFVIWNRKVLTITFRGKFDFKNLNPFRNEFDLRNPKVIGLLFVTCLLLTSCSSEPQFRTIYRIHYSVNYDKTDTIETSFPTRLRSFEGTNKLETVTGSCIISTTAPIEIVSCKRIKRR